MIRVNLQLFGGRGASGKHSVPSEEEIKMGIATYGGIQIQYNPNMDADARNQTTRILVSDKFFSHDEATKRDILTHEVSHNLSDKLIERNSSDWDRFSNAFVTEKPVPKGSAAWERGQRTYIEGLYGDIGSTAIVETTTRAITEYMVNPERLRSRSQSAYNIVNKFMRGRK